MEIPNIEALIPHRQRMKLIGKIIAVDHDAAVTESVLTHASPLAGDGFANPVILLELAAQTAGVCIGYREYRKNNADNRGRGWLVGVKKAEFYLAQIPLETIIVTTSRNLFNFEKFMEISAVSAIAEKTVSEVILQVVWSNENEPQPSEEKNETL